MNYTQIINKTEEYIESHLSEPISLDDLAYHLGISPFHFHRVFKSYTTETLHQFISRIKMERSAIILLTNPSVTITHLAYTYGYSDTSSYIRAFKRHFKMTPTQFKRARNDNQ